MTEISLKDIEQLLDVKIAPIEKTLSQHTTALEKLATKQDVRNAVEELARITNTGFADILERLDVRQRVQQLEADIQHIKQALHLTH